MTTATVLQGDARILIRDIPDKSIDFILWDPDYGVKGVQYGDQPVTGDAAIAFLEDLLPVLRQKSRTGQLVMFWSASVERERALYASRINHIWPIYFHGIWYKPNGAGPTGNGIARRYESWFWLKDGPKPRHTEWHAIMDVLEECRIVRRSRDDAGHPSQKPARLCERLIRFFTTYGDMVLDPTCGSGSAGVAAKQCGRNFIGFEINPAYVQMARFQLDRTTEMLPLVGDVGQVDLNTLWGADVPDEAADELCEDV